MNRPLRWGILGAGVIAGAVAVDVAAASSGSVLAAVAARDTARAAAFARRHAVPRAYGSYAELVADPDVDIVYVATTHPQHRDHALLALHAGKNLLLEKPFTLNGQQGRQVINAARNANVFCMEAMWMRMHPLIRRAQALVHGGSIGDVISVHANLSRRVAYDPHHRLFDPAVGGGALLDLGIYPAHLAWLFLGRPDSVHATASLAPTGVDDTVGMRWGYHAGRFAQLASSLSGDDRRGALITGTRGRIVIHPPMQVPTRMTVNTGQADETIHARTPGHGYGPEIAEVERCIRTGLPESPLVPPDHTAAILDVLDDTRRQIGLRYPSDS